MKLRDLINQVTEDKSYANKILHPALDYDLAIVIDDGYAWTGEISMRKAIGKDQIGLVISRQTFEMLKEVVK